MVDNKRKKNTRMRGKTTHGYGSMKKNRGAGNRGGRGMAGSGKRADQKKPTILKKYGSSYYGKKGFNTHTRDKNTFLNLEYINKKLKDKKGDFFIFDASKYSRVLSKGVLTKKVKITCKSFSKSALEKIKKAGGEAIICS
jgi:large subunit ribosomal protein L15